MYVPALCLRSLTDRQKYRKHCPFPCFGRNLNIPFEQVQKERDEVLACGCEEIRALAPYLRAVFSRNNLCVIGNGERVEESRELFKTVENLFH